MDVAFSFKLKLYKQCNKNSGLLECCICCTSDLTSNVIGYALTMQGQTLLLDVELVSKLVQDKVVLAQFDGVGHVHVPLACFAMLCFNLCNLQIVSLCH